jgi:hypothetical protein
MAATSEEGGNIFDWARGNKCQDIVEGPAHSETDKALSAA